MSEPTQAAVAHVVDVTEGGSVEIDHKDCPAFLDSTGTIDHECLLGRTVRFEGWDEQFDQPLAPGRYSATAWAYQTTDPRCYGEWVGGIDVKPLVDEQAGASLPAQAVEGGGEHG